jgi:hypothetical protein
MVCNNDDCDSYLICRFRLPTLSFLLRILLLGKESIPVFVMLMNETASSKVSKRCTQEKLV